MKEIIKKYDIKIDMLTKWQKELYKQLRYVENNLRSAKEERAHIIKSQKII